MKNYIIFKEKSDLNQSVYTYGIKYKDTDFFVSDISCNKEAVLHMCDSFNRNDLSPHHLKDAVEDFIAAL